MAQWAISVLYRRVPRSQLYVYCAHLSYKVAAPARRAIGQRGREGAALLHEPNKGTRPNGKLRTAYTCLRCSERKNALRAEHLSFSFKTTEAPNSAGNGTRSVLSGASAAYATYSATSLREVTTRDSLLSPKRFTAGVAVTVPCLASEPCAGKK